MTRENILMLPRLLSFTYLQQLISIFSEAWSFTSVGFFNVFIHVPLFLHKNDSLLLKWIRIVFAKNPSEFDSVVGNALFWIVTVTENCSEDLWNCFDWQSSNKLPSKTIVPRLVSENNVVQQIPSPQNLIRSSSWMLISVRLAVTNSIFWITFRSMASTVEIEYTKITIFRELSYKSVKWIKVSSNGRLSVSYH